MSTLYSTSINLGSSATFDAGTQANNIVQLDANAKLPAVDGSLLTNLPASNITGALVYRGVYDATANNPPLTNAVKGDFYKVSVQGTLAGVALNVNDHIIFNQDASSPIISTMFDVIDNTETSLATVANTGSYNDLINKPTLGTASALDVGTGANEIVQLNASSQLPALDGSLLTSITSTDSTKLAIANDLNDLNNVATARTNLGLATVASTGSYNDLSNKPTLGTASALDVGTGANEIVQLNASSQLPALDGSLLTSITSTDSTKLAIANDLNDLNNVATARTNLGLATVASTGSYNDLSNKPTLGTASALDVGTGANEIVQLNASSQLPALDGSLLTSITSTDSTKLAIANDLNDLNNVATARTNLGLATVASTGSYNDLSNKPTLGTASALDVGTGANEIVQLNASSQLPALDGSLLTSITSTDSTKLAIANDLNDLNNVATARTNLGLATVASTGSYNDLSNKPTLGTASALDVGTGANEIVQLNASSQLPALDGSLLTSITSTDSTKLAIANDLNDLNNVATARTNLGLATVASTGSYNDLSNKPTLGTASALDVGTGANEIVQLNASSQLPALDGSLLTSITSTDSTKLAIANDLNDLNNVATARTNLGLATVASTGSYNDLSNKPTLGTASALDVGTGANEIVQLNASSQLPALDGSLLTNLPSGATILNGLSDVTTTNPSANQALIYDNLNSVFINADIDYNNVTNKPVLATVATSGSYNDLSNKPTLGTASALDVGTGANEIVQLNASSQLPALDGSLLTDLPVRGLIYQARNTTNHSPLAPPLANYHYSINANSANFVISLDPLSSYSAGDQIRIKLQAQTSTYNVTINANGSDTIDGQTNSSPLVLSVLYQAVTLVRGATEWEVI